MEQARLTAFCLLLTLLATEPATVVFAQDYDLQMTEIDRAASIYRARLVMSPVSSDSQETAESGHSGTPLEGSQSVALEFTVQLDQSNEWLLEDIPGRELTDEEVFTRDLFLAYRSATSWTELRNYMDEEMFREREAQYARNEELRQRQLTALREYSDVRLLGVIRYGEYHFFLTIMKRPSETAPEMRAGVTTRKHQGRYVQTSELDTDSTTSLFQTQALRRAIYSKLDEFVQ